MQYNLIKIYPEQQTDYVIGDMCLYVCWYGPVSLPVSILQRTHLVKIIMKTMVVVVVMMHVVNLNALTHRSQISDGAKTLDNNNTLS